MQRQIKIRQKTLTTLEVQQSLKNNSDLINDEMNKLEDDYNNLNNKDNEYIKSKYRTNQK